MKKIFYFFIFAIPIISLAAAFSPVEKLTISDGSSTHTFLLNDDGINITIFYIHSVEKSPIYEVLKANASGIYAIEMRWQDFGAGLPEDFQYVKDGFYVKKIDVYLGKSLNYWFIPQNHAKIWVNGVLIFTPQKEGLIKFDVEESMLISTI